MTTIGGQGTLDALRRRVRDLETAIIRHRNDVWGSTKVRHPEDVRLYQVLSDGNADGTDDADNTEQESGDGDGQDES